MRTDNEVLVDTTLAVVLVAYFYLVQKQRPVQQRLAEEEGARREKDTRLPLFNAFLIDIFICANLSKRLENVRSQAEIQAREQIMAGVYGSDNTDIEFARVPSVVPTSY
jgi:hypothetical protein